MKNTDSSSTNADGNSTGVDGFLVNADSPTTIITYDPFIPLGSDSFVTFDAEEFYVRAA